MANTQSYLKRTMIIGVLVGILGISCSTQYRISRVSNRFLLNDSVLKSAHIGIAIQDANNSKYLYKYQGDHFFVPASNTKIFSCYAGMKYLGAQLPGIKYANTADGLVLQPTGDPTLLHPDYKNQPVIDFLKKQSQPLSILHHPWKTTALGMGWSWDDYNEDYMPERSALPVYGNVIRWVRDMDTSARENLQDISSPAVSFYAAPEVNFPVKFLNDTLSKRFHVQRDLGQNIFTITEGKEKHKELDVPFVTQGIQTALALLKDTIARDIKLLEKIPATSLTYTTVYSQPTDAVLKPMMHRSDNFFAEQILLMASAEKLGIFDEHKMMRHILKVDLAGLPQQPTWADGSGLSRFNLFTPDDFVFLLGQMQQEFGMQRIQEIFETGNSGTLAGLYKNEVGAIYAKTGTLTGVVALSGYLTTKKGKQLIFSVLVNNHTGRAAAVRKQLEKFLVAVREKY